MPDKQFNVRKPRCFLVYALAPDDLSPAEANRQFNNFVADPDLPLAVFHDHFIGQPGGVAIFFTQNREEGTRLVNHDHLTDWHVEYRPLIFSFSPAAFDEQIAFTLKQYRQTDWEVLQNEKRPAYGNPALEAQTAQEI
ncbi:MAG TPA: hypothetical protein ENK32_02010 [Anaerolineae bacterium]|nr:hypothetical protein [Anaerolineae bacterium]